MTNVRKLEPPKAMPDDFPAALRKLASNVESGRVTAMVVACVADGCYEFLWPSSLSESVLLTTMAQQSAIDNMRR